MTNAQMEQIYGRILWTDKPRNFFGMALNFTRYILTEKKLIVRKGWLNIREDKIELYRITDTTILLPLVQRIFGLGTINIVSKDASLPRLRIMQIKDPYSFHRKLEEAVEHQKREYNVLGMDMVGVSTFGNQPPQKPGMP